MKKWILLFAPYVLVVGVAFGGLYSLENEAHQRCLDRQTDRQVLRQVVDIATTPGTSRLDLTVVPGFDDLDSATQAFMRNLSQAIAAAPPQSRNALHDTLLAQLPPIDC